MHMSNLQRTIKRLFTTGASLCLLFSSSVLSAEIWGKVDVAPAYVHIDVLEHEKTVHRIDMCAFKGDATVIVWKGLCFKPTVLAGGSGGGNIVTTGLGLGFCTPCWDWLVLTPSAGCLYTNMTTHIDLDIPFPLSPTGFFHLHRVRENFWSVSPYIALEATFRIRCDFRICAQFQYAWSTTHTTLSKHEAFPNGKRFKHTDKSHSDGPSYGVLVEYDLNDCFSINAGAAYNLTLTKEKHGLRGYGGKLGLAYWF